MVLVAVAPVAATVAASTAVPVAVVPVVDAVTLRAHLVAVAASARDARTSVASKIRSRHP